MTRFSDQAEFQRFFRHAIRQKRQTRTNAPVDIGLVGGFGLTRVLWRLLADVSPNDPWVFVLTPVLIAWVEQEGRRQ